MSASQAFTRTWKVGAFTATFCSPQPKPGAITNAVIEWDPHIPQRLTPQEQEQYRAGLAEATRAWMQERCRCPSPWGWNGGTVERSGERQ